MTVIIDNIDDKIVIFGQSCSGKTTFAKLLAQHHYYCFDNLFEWHQFECLGLSAEMNFRHICEICQSPKYVLDGWHLADKEGKYLPKNSRVYVVYCSYEQIVDQYRIEVKQRDEYLMMYKRWYSDVDYEKLHARYVKNDKQQFIETDRQEFEDEIRSSLF